VSQPVNDDSSAAGALMMAMPTANADCTSAMALCTCFSTESAVLMNDDGPGSSPASTKVSSKLAICPASLSSDTSKSMQRTRNGPRYGCTC
jgi:hypothetical protein